MKNINNDNIGVSTIDMQDKDSYRVKVGTTKKNGALKTPDLSTLAIDMKDIISFPEEVDAIRKGIVIEDSDLGKVLTDEMIELVKNMFEDFKSEKKQEFSYEIEDSKEALDYINNCIENEIPFLIDRFNDIMKRMNKDYDPSSSKKILNEHIEDLLSDKDVVSNLGTKIIMFKFEYIEDNLSEVESDVEYVENIINELGLELDVEDIKDCMESYSILRNEDYVALDDIDSIIKEVLELELEKYKNRDDYVREKMRYYGELIIKYIQNYNLYEYNEVMKKFK